MRGPDPASATCLRFRDAAPHLDTQHCLNNRHKAAACTRCAVACPVQAITVGQGVPRLDPERCVGCGVCQVACPTDVFPGPTSPEPRLVETVAQTSAAAVQVVCPLHPDPGLTVAPVDVVVRHRRCLAALSIPDLLTMTQEGRRSIWLDDSACATCPLAEAHTTLHATTRVAQALGRPARIQLQSDHLELVDVAPCRRPLLDGAQPRISRRHLFGLVRSTTRQPTPNTTDSPSIELRAKPAIRRLSQRVPSSRLRLLDHLRRIPVIQEHPLARDAIPFARVEVDGDRCSACGLCADFCPTAALRFEVEAQQYALKFRADLCIDCSICTIACPEDAVHVSSTVDIGPIIAGDARNLIDGTLVSCRLCGAATAARGERPFCHSCRHGSGRVRSLLDEAGLLTDLLHHIPACDKAPAA